MNVICTHAFRLLVANLKDFKLDLGMSYSNKDEKGHLYRNIKDKFVIDFSKQNRGMLYKVGVFGPASFYTYSYIPNDEVWFYKGDKLIIKKVDMNEASLDFENYLAKMIWSIENDIDS